MTAKPLRRSAELLLLATLALSFSAPAWCEDMFALFDGGGNAGNASYEWWPGTPKSDDEYRWYDVAEETNWSDEAVGSFRASIAAGDRIPGYTCVCEERGQGCVQIWAHMAYLDNVYNTKFKFIGQRASGCGEANINGRIGGRIRLLNQRDKCLQLYGDVEEGEATHLWGNCDGSHNPQRRAMVYIDKPDYQTIRVGEDASYCLVLRNSGFADGNPIVAENCLSVDPDRKKWLYEDNQLKLKADPTKCIRKAGASQDFSVPQDIVLGACQDDDSDRWMISWSEYH